MKSACFHEIHLLSHEIHLLSWNPPAFTWNPPAFMKSACFHMKSACFHEIHLLSHEIHQLSWNPPAVTWNLPVFMKSTCFHMKSTWFLNERPLARNANPYVWSHWCFWCKSGNCTPVADVPLNQIYWLEQSLVKKSAFQVCKNKCININIVTVYMLLNCKYLQNNFSIS